MLRKLLGFQEDDISHVPAGLSTITNMAKYQVQYFKMKLTKT
jgi:hypothetical protein